jgi:branched-chain amino acid transport system ATP-binding protein
MALLETQNLTKQFAGLTAVDRVSIAVDAGETRAVIGPNGAGKSTLINCITGLLEPSSGTVLFKDEDITAHDSHDIVQRGISRSFQTASIFPGMSVYENVQIAAFGTKHGAFRFNFLRDRDSFGEVDQLTTEILDSVELLEHAQETAANLPYGDKRRLEIAIGLASEPDLMFMDEPTAGMSPEETQHTVDLLEELKEDRGLTIVLVEHDMEVIFRVADRISVLHRGEIIASGPPDEVKGDADVQEAYLGGVEL